MKVVNIIDFKNISYREQLEKFYYELDNDLLPAGLTQADRRKFFIQSRLRFIKICRLKRNTPLEDRLEFLKIAGLTLDLVETGSVELTDRQFQMLITYLGCRDEFANFIEKIVTAMNPHFNNYTPTNP